MFDVWATQSLEFTNKILFVSFIFSTIFEKKHLAWFMRCSIRIGTFEFGLYFGKTNLTWYKDFGTQTNISGIIAEEHERKWKLKAQKTIGTILILSLLENCFKNKRTYNEVVYDLSQLTYLYSPKTYNLIKQFIPLPSF